MAKREGLIFKFFEKWKERKMSKLANNMLKDNPSLEKNLKDLDKAFGKLEVELEKRKKKFNIKQYHGKKKRFKNTKRTS